MPPRRSVSPPEKEGEMGGEGEKLTPQTNSCPCKAGEGILQQLSHVAHQWTSSEKFKHFDPRMI